MMIIIVRDNALICAHHYRVSGVQLVSSEQIHALAAFKVDGSIVENNDQSEIGLMGAANAQLHYQGEAQFDRKMRGVSFWRSGHYAQLDVDDEPVCSIDLKQGRIIILNDASFDQSLNLEVITGPALILLLLLRDVYCLHASCVTVSGSKSLAFLADSGTGKSTLSKHSGSHWLQRADDILPVTLHDGVFCFESFPQLKLENAVPNESGIINGWTRLDGLLCLSTQPTAQIMIRPLSKLDAMLAVIRHTVAARLFDQNQVKQHLVFAKHVTEKLPIFSVSYPRAIQQLPELQAQIQKHFT